VFWSSEELERLQILRPFGTVAAAEKGDADAQYEVGRFLYSWKWFCLAANQNHIEAAYRVAVFYEAGNAPVSHDPVRAYMWYSLAASREAEYAAKDMTPEQIAEAERLVAEWEPNPSECEASTTAVSAQ
jgi:hypothetical protein